MIIGEETNNNYDGYEESYDYLFKKRKGAGPTPRQQKKAEKKAGQPAKKPGRFAQKRQDRKAGIAPPKKRLIMGNFGLFNKNKKREEAAAAKAAAAQAVIPPPDAEQLPEANPLDESPQSQDMNTGMEENMPSMPEENPEAGMPEGAGGEEASESSYDEAGKASASDSKEPGKGKEKKASINLDWVGWTFLGLTVAGIGYLIYSMEKNKQTQLLPSARSRSELNLK